MTNPKTQVVASRVAEMKVESAKVMQHLKEEHGSSRFLLGSQTETRLKKALAAVNRQDLLATTLLTPAIHEAHANKLTQRYLQLWGKVRDKQQADWQKIPAEFRRGSTAPNDAYIASNHLRFFTLVDSITVVDANAAMQAATRMRAELTRAVNSVKGLHMFGAIEAEVISLSAMRTIRDKDTNGPSEKRKLDVCEELALEFKDTLYQCETNLFLIHFHGVLIVKQNNQFEDFRNQLLTNARWARAARQIEIKKLSEEFAGKAKTVEQNLAHIARYITKGGNDWVGGAIALRYKIGFSRVEDSFDEADDARVNWRRNKLLRAEHKNEGIDDAMSESPRVLRRPVGLSQAGMAV